MSSQKTDISSIGLNLSQMSSTGPSSDNSEATVQLKYSRRTRKNAQKRMSKKHVIEHQSDILRHLKCHKFRDNEVVGRNFIFALLWLALNQIDDSMQMSDLIRYAKESHIKLNNISSFLPPNINAKQAVNHFRKSSNDNLNHSQIRSKVLVIAEVLNIRDFNMPNMPNLCERYVKDLCLPAAVGDMIKRLIAFHSPEMNPKNSSTLTRTVPNYEGRAMAFIIFMLKLIFGLDDKREHDISASAQTINKLLIESDAKQSPLFVWSEWVKYIDMRNVILSQCHYPTAMQINPNANMHTDMYIDFLKRANDDGQCNENYRKREMENIRVIFDQIVQLHRENDERKKPSCHFEPSKTPFYSYMENIKNDRTIKSKIYVPEFMNIDHDTHDIMAYVKPKNLKKLFREFKYHLDVKEVAYNREMIFSNVSHENVKKTEEVEFEFDVTMEEWLRGIKKRDKLKQLNKYTFEIENDELIKCEIDQHLQKLHAKQVVCDSEQRNVNDNEINSNSDRFFDEEEDNFDNDEIVLKEPRRDLDEQPNMLRYQSSDEDDDQSTDSNFSAEKSIDFVISNFDYWIALQNIYYITNASFDETFKDLPTSFQWLLKQCALQIQMPIKDLYIELLAIENEYRYILKPIFKMKNHIEYRELTINKLDHGTLNAARLLKRIW